MHKIAAFMVVLASVIWATGGPAVKVLLNYGLTENEIFFTKAFFCVISMLLFDLICRKRIKRISSVKDFFCTDDLRRCGIFDLRDALWICLASNTHQCCCCIGIYSSGNCNAYFSYLF